MKLSGDDLRDKFPQKNVGLSKGKSMNKYWNFLNDEGSDLRMEAFKEQRWHMFVYPENGGQEEVVAWFANLDVWWSHFFGDKLGKISEVVGKNKGQWS